MIKQYKRNWIFRTVCIMLLLAAFFVFGAFQVQASETVTVGTEQELVNAIENAQSGTTIKLDIPGNVKILDISKTLVIPQGKAVTIDLNGGRLQSDPPDFVKLSEGMILMEIEGELTVKDSSENKEGVLCGNHEATVVVEETGTFNFESGTITSVEPNPGLSGEYNGVYNLGVFNMSGGKIEHCIVKSLGGAIYTKGAVNITGGEIAFCSARDGGAIAVVGDKPINISNLKIYSCTAREAGGAIYTGENAEINITASKFTDNKALFIGGAIATTPSTYMTLTDTEITKNLGARDGGLTNACGPGNLVIGGKVLIYNNLDGKEHQSNLAIMDNSSIVIDPTNPLSADSKIGIYQSEFTTKDLVIAFGAQKSYINKNLVTDYPETDTMSYMNNGRAKITSTPFNISFVTNCDQSVESQQVNRFGHAENPGDLSRSGWIFEGWFYSSDFDEEIPWIFEINTVNSDMTLYAKWTPKKEQNLKIASSSFKVKSSALKKHAVKTKAVKVKGDQGVLTYSKVSGSKNLKISPSTGKITVKKGTLKGSYKIKVKANSAENDNYKQASKSKTIKVIVK